MKRKGVLLLGAVLSLLAIGCHNPVSSSVSTAQPSGLTIVWAENAGSRTILPANYPTPATYDITLAAPGQNTVSQTGIASTSSSWTASNLAAALWSITVNGKDSQGTILVTGTASADLTTQTTQSVNVSLRYLVSGTGTGSIGLTVDFSAIGDPGSLTLASVSVADPSGTISLNSLLPLAAGKGTFNLNPAAIGSYKVLFKASTATKTALKYESLLVVRGTATVATIAFSPGDFAAIYVPVSTVTVAPSAQSMIIGGAPVTLVATVVPSNASNLSVVWSSDNPAVASVDPSSGMVTAVAFGTATITAASVDGNVKGTCAVTVLPDNSPTKLAAAKALLKNKQYDEALAAFEQSGLPEAAAYKALLKLASVSVNPAVVDAAKNCLGMHDYPSTMDALFSSGWLRGQFYAPQTIHEYYPNVAIPGTNSIVPGYDVFYTNYFKTVVPAIDIPVGIVPPAGSPGLSPTQYIESLILNVVSKNPSGVNALMDALDSGVFGSDFDTALSYLAAVPSDAVITLDYSETTILPSWVSVPSLSPVKIGKAELLAEAGTLKVLRGLFQIVKAYNFDFGGKAIASVLDPATGKFSGAILGTNPIQGGFLSLRDPASLGRSQASIGGGVGDLKSAIDMIAARTSADPFDLSPAVLGPLSGALVSVSTVLGQLQSAIASGGSIWIPSNPQGLLDGSADLLRDSAGQKPEVKLGALFDSVHPLVSLGELVDLNSGGSSPRWYAQAFSVGGPFVEVGPGLPTPMTSVDILWIHLHWGAIAQKFFPLLTIDPSANPYVPVSLFTQGDKLMAWFGETWTAPAAISVGAY